MENKNIILLVVALSLVFLCAGFGTGFFIEKKTIDSIFKIINSKVIPSITAYGQVSKISGRNITLTSNGEDMVIPIKQGADVSTLNSNFQTPGPARTISTFGAIKVGDELSIKLEILSDGQVQGSAVLISPAL